jgi:hypothetical protein
MPMTAEPKFERAFEGPGYNVHRCQADLSQVWASVRERTIKIEELIELLSERRSTEMAVPPVPFEAKSPPDGLEPIVATILVGAAGSLAGHVSARVLDYIWDKWFWPEYEQLRGGVIKPAETLRK